MKENQLTTQDPMACTTRNPAGPAVGGVSDQQRMRLERHLREAAQQVAPITPDLIPARFGFAAAPLTFSQEQLYLRAQENADKPPFYNETITIHRKGALSVAALERSLLEVIRRHEIWRTTFEQVDGAPAQIVHRTPDDFGLRLLDLSALPKPEQEAQLLRSVGELAERPFDLAKGPLLRFLLVKLGELWHQLVLVAHQIVVDGVSAYQLLPRELAVLYEAFSTGKDSPLPELEIHFGDYAAWQRRRDSVKDTNRQTEYWRKRLANELPALQWPDGRQTGASSHRGLIRPFAFTTKASAAIRSASQREGVTLFISLLSGFVALLRHYTAQDDIVVGTLSPAGRKQAQVQELLGYFLNPVALRFDLSGDPTFRELLQQAREVLSEAISHDDIPIEVLAEKLGLRGRSRDLPPSNVGISLQPPVPQGLRPEWDVTSMDVGSGGTVWDLYLAFIDGPDGLVGRAQYNLDIFRAETIVQMLADLEAVLEASSSQPHLRLSELPGLIDRAGIARNGGGTAGDSNERP